MRMRLFLIFHLEKCFEEFQHRTEYFMKIQLICCFPEIATLARYDCAAALPVRNELISLSF